MRKPKVNKATKNIKCKDTVLVLAGRDKGKSGVVLKVLREANRAVVEKINMVKRHAKPDAKNRQGGIIEKELPIHLSNLKKVESSAKVAKK